MGLVDKYMLLWAASLGTSIIIVVIAMVVGLAFAETGNFVLSLSALMFNMTAGAFVILTMIPVGVTIIVVGSILNLLGPVVFPIIGAFLDPVMAGLSLLLTGSTSAYTPIATSFVTISIEGTINATVTFLNGIKLFFINQILIAGGSVAEEIVLAQIALR